MEWSAFKSTRGLDRVRESVRLLAPELIEAELAASVGVGQRQ